MVFFSKIEGILLLSVEESWSLCCSPKSRLEGIERGLLGSNPVICSMIQPHPHVSQGPHPLGQPEGDIAHQRELQTIQELSNSSQRIIHMEEESSSQHARYIPIGHKQQIIISEVNQDIKMPSKTVYLLWISFNRKYDIFIKNLVHNIILLMNFFDSLGTIYGFPTEATTVEGKVIFILTFMVKMIMITIRSREKCTFLFDFLFSLLFVTIMWFISDKLPQ